MKKTLQEINREILNELTRISRISIGDNQIICLVKNPFTDEMEYTIGGGAPFKQGISEALRDCNIYDIVNALFTDNLGYNVTISNSYYHDAFCITMSARDGD